MFKKGLMVLWWFPLSAVFLIFNLTLLNQKSQDRLKTTIQDEIQIPVANQVHFLSDRGTGKILGDSIVAGDGRSDLLHNFMKDSPMDQYADVIIREADKYNLDFRLVPAIAMCESNLGRHIPSSDSFNAWGIAVYTGQNNGAKFGNWEQAIVWVNKFIFDKFINRRVIDIKDIGAIWAPPSVEKGHSWANCVESFMRQIQ